MPVEDSPVKITNKSSIVEEHRNSIQEVNTPDIALSAIQDNPETLLIENIPVALSIVKKDEKLNYFTGAIQSENEEDEDDDKDN